MKDWNNLKHKIKTDNFAKIEKSNESYIYLYICDICDADSYPLSSRELMAIFLCVSSDRLGKNDLQS